MSGMGAARMQAEMVYDAESQVRRELGLLPQLPGHAFPAGDLHPERVAVWVRDLVAKRSVFNERLGHLREIRCSWIRRDWFAPDDDTAACARLRPRLRIGEIKFHRQGISRWTVLHELAHLAEWEDDHGPHFCRTLIDFIGDGISPEAGELLSKALHERGRLSAPEPGPGEGGA